MTMQRDLRPFAPGKAATVQIVALALFSLFLISLVHGQFQSSLRHIGFYRADGGMASISVVCQWRAFVYITKDPVVIELAVQWWHQRRAGDGWVGLDGGRVPERQRGDGGGW
jgi:hypothetical protein